MIKKINHARLFLDDYLIFFLIGFALLTLLPYVSFLSVLQINHVVGIIYRGALSLIICITFLGILIIYKTNVPVFLLIISIFYLVAQIISISITPILYDSNIPTITSIMGFWQATTIVISSLFYISVQSKCKFNWKTTKISCLLMSGIGVVLCLYTYVFQWDSIYYTFNSDYGWNYDVTSIFSLKTEYGFTLFICSIFSFYYSLSTKKYWFYVIPFFFLLNMLISRSKTSVLCTSIIFLSHLVYHIVHSWQTKRKKWIVSSVIVTTLALAILFLTIYKVWWFEKLNNFISKVIIGDAIVVFNDRVQKWSSLIIFTTNPFSIIFGYGERIAAYVLNKYGCSAIEDNIYVSTYSAGGMTKLFLYFLILFISFKKNVQNSPPKYKAIVFATMLSFLAGGLFEDDSIIGLTTSALFSSVIYHNCNKMIIVEHPVY